MRCGIRALHCRCLKRQAVAIRLLRTIPTHTSRPRRCHGPFPRSRRLANRRASSPPSSHAGLLQYQAPWKFSIACCQRRMTHGTNVQLRRWHSSRACTTRSNPSKVRPKVCKKFHQCDSFHLHSVSDRISFLTKCHVKSFLPLTTSSLGL